MGQPARDPKQKSDDELEIRLDEHGNLIFEEEPEETPPTPPEPNAAPPDGDMDVEQEPGVEGEPVPDDTPDDTDKGDGTDKDDDAYSPDDLKETDFEHIDPNKLPEPLKALYKGMQASYTKKMQSISKPTPPTSPQPDSHEPPAMSQEEARAYLFELAKDEACSLLKIKREEFDDLNPEHVAMLSVATNTVYQAAMAEARKQQMVTERQRQYQELLAKVQEEEPHYDEINQWAMKYVYDELPYKEYQRIMGIFAEGDMEKINGIVNDLRKEWYARFKKQPKKKKVAQPPSVEPGSDNAVTVPTPPNPAEFGRLSVEEQGKWLEENGFVEL